MAGSNRCSTCSNAVDDHDTCSKCGKVHCEHVMCPVEMKEALGPTPAVTDPTAKPNPCRHCGESMDRWDQKAKLWRPAPRVSGKARVCHRCRKDQ
jgi:hypothetical protein